MIDEYVVLKQKQSNPDGTHDYEVVKINGRSNKFQTEAEAQDWINKNGKNGEPYLIGRAYMQS